LRDAAGLRTSQIARLIGTSRTTAAKHASNHRRWMLDRPDYAALSGAIVGLALELTFGRKRQGSAGAAVLRK